MILNIYNQYSQGMSQRFCQAIKDLMFNLFLEDTTNFH